MGGTMGLNEASIFLHRCTDGKIDVLGGKLARALNDLAAHHALDVQDGFRAPSNGTAKQPLLRPVVPMRLQTTSVPAGVSSTLADSTSLFPNKSCTPEQRLPSRGSSGSSCGKLTKLPR